MLIEAKKRPQWTKQLAAIDYLATSALKVKPASQLTNQVTDQPARKQASKQGTTNQPTNKQTN